MDSIKNHHDDRPADEQLAVDTRATPVASPAWTSVTYEADLLRILDSTVSGESIAALYDRRERELVQLFSQLTVAECFQLRQRLSSATPEDPVAARFHRIILPRRNRLLAFLADGQRRERLAERQSKRERRP